MGSKKRSMTRAEAVRQRRNQHRSRSSRRKTNRRRARSGTPPPMVVRSDKISAFASRAKRRRRGNSRRRFDIALGVPGAELHLPALPVIRFGWRLLSGVLVVLLLGVMYTLWNSPTYQVVSASVGGTQRLTAQEVNTVLNVAGSSIFAVEPERLKRELKEAFPELHEISIRVNFPAQVVVEVAERQPVLAWKQGSLTFWIDEDGVAFPPRGEVDLGVTVEAMDAPKIELEELDDPAESQVFLDPHLITPILTVGEQAPEDAALLYDREHGLGWRDPRGWQVFLGLEAGEMDTRLKVYEALVEHLNREQIVPAMISVEYVDAPYYRMDR